MSHSGTPAEQRRCLQTSECSYISRVESWELTFWNDSGNCSQFISQTGRSPDVDIRELSTKWIRHWSFFHQERCKSGENLSIFRMVQFQFRFPIFTHIPPPSPPETNLQVVLCGACCLHWSVGGEAEDTSVSLASRLSDVERRREEGGLMLRHLWQSRLYLHCSTAYHQPLSAILQKYFTKLKISDSEITLKGWIFPTNWHWRWREGVKKHLDLYVWREKYLFEKMLQNLIKLNSLNSTNKTCKFE